MTKSNIGEIGGEILQYVAAVFLGVVFSLLMMKFVFWPQNGGSLYFLIILICFIATSLALVRVRILSKKLTESQRQAKIFRDKDEVKTRFLAFAAHNLRTPATAFRWTLSEFIKSQYEHLNNDQKKSIRSLYSVSLAMLTLIEDFLDISKLELHQLEITLKAVSLKNFREEVNRIIKELEPVSKDKDIFIEKYLGSSNDNDLVHVDILRIGRVVENLVENSINYTLEGGKISVRLKQKPDSIEFSVEDNGIGIPEAEQAEIFKQFFRSSNARKHKSTGSGIGLFLAAKLVEAHNGNISFTSKQDEGSTFTFTIPTIQKGEQEVVNVFKRL